MKGGCGVDSYEAGKNKDRAGMFCCELLCGEDVLGISSRVGPVTCGKSADVVMLSQSGMHKSGASGGDWG